MWFPDLQLLSKLEEFVMAIQMYIFIPFDAKMYCYTLNNLGISVLMCFCECEVVLVNEVAKMLQQFELIGFIFQMTTPKQVYSQNW